MKHAKGFTLIELLLVVGIVTLLSSVLFYNTSEAKKKAEDSHMQAESEQVKTAVTLYKNDTGRYPLTSTGPVPSSRRGMLHSEADPNSDYIATMQELVNGGYISEIPRSPDGQSYAYGVSEDGENAMFVATLKRSGSSGGGSSKNSCNFSTATESLSNCRMYSAPPSPYTSWAEYQTNNPNTLLSGYTTGPFCTTYNTELIPNYLGVCTCISPPLPVGRCNAAYGSTRVMAGTNNYRLVCDKSSSVGVCDGSSENDYCECI